MAVVDEVRVINEANAVVARIQTFTNLKNLGCSLLLFLGSIVFLVLIIYRGVFEGLTISFFVLMSIGMAAIMLIQSLESWLAQSARDAFNIKFPARLRKEEREMALDHIASLNTKNDAIKILLRELGYEPGKLKAAPESQLNSQLQQLDSPSDSLSVNSISTTDTATKIPDSPSPSAVSAAKASPVSSAPPTPVSAPRQFSVKPSGGKKVIPLDPFGGDN